MKVCFCIKAMNNPGGGAERVLAAVASGLAMRGHEIMLLTFDAPGGRSFFTLDPRIQRVELGIGSTSGSATLMETVHRMAGVRASIKSLAPDVAIAFMHSTYILLGLALLGTSIPVIASEHIVPEHYRSRPLEALLLRLTPFTAKRITCVSDQVRNSFPSSLSRRMVAIANPLMEAKGRADVTGLAVARKILLTVGRLDPQKDHETLIDAFAIIADHHPDWDLRIVGDGNLRGKLEQRIAALGLGRRIHLPGVSKNVSEEYTAAHLFVLPSRYESLGLTTAEAMAHGLPAIGFDDCPGTRWLIRPGVNGELVDGSGNRPAALAAALQPLMKDGDLRARLSMRSLEVSKQFGLKDILDRWERLIWEVKVAA